VYSIECLRPLLDIEAYSIHHAIGTFDSRGDGSFFVDICKDRIASGVKDPLPVGSSSKHRDNSFCHGFKLLGAKPGSLAYSLRQIDLAFDDMIFLITETALKVLRFCCTAASTH
jgi:hypothetical protein